MKDDVALSIVIPAYNEAGRIGLTLERIESFFDPLGIAYEIIVVNDGSNDSTGEVVNTYATANGRIRLIGYSSNRGKGYAVRTGVMNAKAQTVLITDADLATPIEEYQALQQSTRDGYDIVVGSRALEQSRIEGWRPWYRVLSGKIFNKIVRLLTVHDIHDTQCGFKLFTGGSAARIFAVSRINGFGFDVESLFLGSKFGYRINEIAIRWSNSPATKVSVLKDTLPMLWEVLKVRYYDWKKLYDRPKNHE